MTYRQDEKSQSAVTAEELSKIIDEIADEKEAKRVDKKMSGLNGATVAELVQNGRSSSTSSNRDTAIDQLINAQLTDEDQLQQVYNYVQDRNSFAKKLSAFIGALILSPAPLFVLIDIDPFMSNTSIAIGVISFIVLFIAGFAGIVRTVYTHSNKKMGLLNRIRLSLMNREQVNEIKQEYSSKTFLPFLVAGILLVSVVGLIPLFILSIAGLIGTGLSSWLLCIALGVGFIVTTSVTKHAFTRALKADEDNRSYF
ncbi:MAG: hypothetical protein HUJ56_05635 [Erysipelotrichaceae bacterium]|nr:hypothetical protein [Erysipelotrichaceae bacterium]